MDVGSRLVPCRPNEDRNHRGAATGTTRRRSSMAAQTHKRPDLREPIARLLSQLVPAVRDGGEVPLTALVEAIAGRLDDGVRRSLDSRNKARFSKSGEATLFENVGPELKI